MRYTSALWRACLMQWLTFRCIGNNKILYRNSSYSLTPSRTGNILFYHKVPVPLPHSFMVKTLLYWGVKFLTVLFLGVMCLARTYFNYLCIVSSETYTFYFVFVFLSLIFFQTYAVWSSFCSILWLYWPRECWSHRTLNLKMTTLLININFLIYIHMCTLKQSGICIILSWTTLLPIIAV